MTDSSSVHKSPDSALGLRVRVFNCQCGKPVFFRNSACLACSTPLGYLPAQAQIVPLQPGVEAGTWLQWGTQGALFQRCINLDTPAACNWLLPVEEGQAQAGRCCACRLNRTIPDLGDKQHPENAALWGRIELAKRRLVSGLLVLGLPVASRVTEDSERGLMFDFLRARDGEPKVMTGHHDGLITLNIAEADDVHRELARTHMNERYRTLVGHLRHEVGHYYWDRLVANTAWHEEFRKLFGDESQDYAACLQQYYEQGPRADWQSGFVSAYATSHPWEDWAECWAHYMHMSDMVDTASSFGLSIDASRLEYTPFGSEVLYRPEDPGVDRYLAFINHWALLASMVNEMARATGQPEIYPFVLAHHVVTKLHFVHLVVRGERHRHDGAAWQPQLQSQTMGV